MINCFKAEIHKRDALSSVLATLRLLFGRPQVVYCALVQNFKKEPYIKIENLESERCANHYNPQTLTHTCIIQYLLRI